MNNEETWKIANTIFNEIDKLIPLYMQDSHDSSISDGNVAACIIDETGTVYGKMFGADKARQRQSCKIAWTKASQVWLTGIKTGEYERLVFTKQIDENAHGIMAPDLIGWEGGQPLKLRNGQVLSVGFSGFRGTTDLEIVVKALAEAEK